MEKGFEVAVASFRIEQQVADEGDAGALGQVEGKQGFNGFGLLRAGGSLLGDGELRQSGVPLGSSMPALAMLGVSLSLLQSSVFFEPCPSA